LMWCEVRWTGTTVWNEIVRFNYDQFLRYAMWWRRLTSVVTLECESWCWTERSRSCRRMTWTASMARCGDCETTAAGSCRSGRCSWGPWLQRYGLGRSLSGRGSPTAGLGGPGTKSKLILLRLFSLCVHFRLIMSPAEKRLHCLVTI